MANTEFLSALEAVLNVDLENDPELIAAEATVGAAEYAIESASFEIDNGNDEFIPIVEAALSKAKDGFSNWFESLKKKVITFVRAATQTVRAMLSRVSNAARIAKAKGMIKTLDKKVEKSATGIATIQASTHAYLDAGLLVPVDAAISMIVTGAINAMKKNDGVPETFKDSMAKKISAPKTTKGKGVVPVNVGMAKAYLDKAVKYLQALSKSFPKAKELINKLNAEDAERGQIRTAVTIAYNICTASLREYYKTAMQAAQAVCKASGSKASKSAPKKDK